MKTIGFVISKKENENRRALLPQDLSAIKYLHQVYVETGYGEVLGYTDNDYRTKGVNMCSREEALSKDIICDPKVGDAEYLNALHPGQTIFGWIHAVQNRKITDQLIANSLTAIAWEDMFYKGKHLFWRNNEIAGEAAIMHAFTLHGIFPYDTKVAILGNGNSARGAYRILAALGAEVVQYNRRSEQLFKEDLEDFDVIVNAILWDTNRKDHIIYKEEIQSSPVISRKLNVAEELIQGDRLRIIWQPGRICEITYQGNLTFSVSASQNTRIIEGDTFECSLLIEGEPLYIDNLRQGNRPPIAYVCGKKSGILFERITENKGKEE